MGYKIYKDSIGEIKVDSEKFWGLLRKEVLKISKLEITKCRQRL